jgi:trimethylamine:corrinoid methyltransferase-like protein
MMLIHTAWLEAAKFLGRGIRTDDFHLALENIKNGGPGANYLMDDMTVKLARGDEFFRHPLFDYSCEFGSGDPMLARAHSKVEELVAAWKSPVPGKVQEAIQRFFADLYNKIEK